MRGEGISKRDLARANRIREKVSIFSVLRHYGYLVHDEERQQQYSCDLHGTGHDSKPSARAYPESNSVYCFACGISRDSIKLVREKENLPFSLAMLKIEKEWGLPPLLWEEEAEEVKEDLFREVEEDPSVRVERLLTWATRDRILGHDRLARLWEVFDNLMLFLPDSKEAVSSQLRELTTIVRKDLGFP